jgi:transcriptional regulator with XRE-family HTH domain
MAKNNVLGINLVATRAKRKLNQRSLALLAGIQPSSLCRYEKGQKTPTIATLTRLAKVLGTTPSILLR